MLERALDLLFILHADHGQKTARPRQIYLGSDRRHYVALEGRRSGGTPVASAAGGGRAAS